MKRLPLSFLFMIVVVALFGQTPKLDSLYMILKNTKIDTVRIKTQIEIGEEQGIMRIGYWDTLATETKKLKLKKEEAHAINNVGLLSRMNNDYPKAIEYYLKAIQSYKELNDLTGLGNTYNNLGFLYENQGNINKALDCYYESLKEREKADDKRGVAESFNNIGFLYRDQGDTAKALEYLFKALNKYKEAENKKGIAISYNNIGLIYKNQGKINNAIAYYIESLTLNREIGNEKGVAFCYNNLSVIYREQNKLDVALDYLIKCKIIREKLNDKDGLSQVYNNLAKFYLQKGNINEAEQYAQKAYEYAQTVKFPARIENAAETLFQIYKHQQKFEKALKMHELYITMRDSLLNEENKKSSFKQQLKYEYDKKEALAQVEQEKKELAFTEQSKRQKLIIMGTIAGLIHVLIFSIFIFNRFRVTQKQKQIIELQKEKVEDQKKIIEEKQKEIIDSIRYAKRIQQSLMPTEKYIQKNIHRLKK